jgi:hypothetical protein
MLALFLLMLSSSDWPKLIYGLGLALSVAAGARYLKPSSEGGLESKPS